MRKEPKTYNSTAPIADGGPWLVRRLPEKKREELRRQREQGVRGKRAR